MKNIFNRRGELTTQQIVTIIILVVSFAIILFLLVRLNLGSTTDSEICHNSVVMKGSSALPSDSVTLNCKTEYICITEDGTCEGLSNPRKVRVDTVNEVYLELAEDMANCFWMYGERKVDYSSESDVLKNNYCSICSQIYFDDSLRNIEDIKEGNISKDGLFNYMAHTKISGKDYSYMEYMAGTNDLNNLKQQALEDADLDGEGTFGQIEIGKQYFVVTGITSNIGKAWVVAMVLGAIPATIALGWIAGAVVIGGAIVVGVTDVDNYLVPEPEILSLTVKGDGVDNKFMLPTIVEANSERFEALNCEDVLSYS